jgi:hypothetical protein
MEDKNLNRGALYTSKDRIFKSGKINVNGDEQQFQISEYTNKEGKKKFPIYVQVGYFNINTKKEEGSNQPDVYGSFEFNTFKFKIAGWKQVKKKDDGNDLNYLSVSVEFDKEQPEKGLNEFEKKLDDKELDDEVPF